MNSRIKIIYLIAFLLLSCTESKRTSTTKIQLSDAMDRPELLDVSELSETVTYIPLETNDSVIVGEIPDITVLDSVVLVSSKSQSLQSFDRRTGKFITKIGHIGNDPEGYAADSWGSITYTVSNNLVYIAGWNNDFQCYDLTGKYKGNIKLDKHLTENGFTMESYYFVVHQDTIWGHNKIQNNNIAPQMVSFSKDGTFIDSVRSRGVSPPMTDFLSGSLLYGAYIPYGGHLYITEYQNEQVVYSVVNSPSLWVSDNKLRFKENFIDTVYTINGNSRTPYLIFELGKWHWDYDKRSDKRLSKEKIAIDYMLEGKKSVYLHFHTGIYEKEAKTYCGIVDKQAGTIRIMEGDKLVTPNGPPIQIRHTSSAGEFVALLQPTDIQKWIEEEKETQLLPKWMKTLKEDDNPIVVILQ